MSKSSGVVLLRTIRYLNFCIFDYVNSAFSSTSVSFPIVYLSRSFKKSKYKANTKLSSFRYI